jgi:copper chaperone CopZ
VLVIVTEATVQIAGMDWSHCAQRLSQALERAEGVIKADVDLAGTATERYEESRISAEQLGDRVREAGFQVA